MAHRIVWLPEAIEDLDAIAEYISEDSPRYASSVVGRALRAVALAAEFPLSGTIVPEWQDETLRQCLVFSYRLIYKVQPSQIEIIAVIHGARSLPDDIRAR